jgi:DNA replicative helicase MCM subunit Mcm2 (Cdc46/Mcm family)
LKLISLSLDVIRLLKEPASWQPAADAALKDTAVNASNDYAHDLKKDTFYVGYKGSFGENHATPRTLKSDKLGKMVCLEGIVTRCKALLFPLFLVSVDTNRGYSSVR